MSGSYTRGGKLRTTPSALSVHPHPTRPGYIITVDELGGIRSGPFGAWWAHLIARRVTACGVTVEIPTVRACTWNAALLAVQGTLAWWAHALGVSWLAIATVLGADLGFGVAGTVYVVRVLVPRSLARHHAQLLAAMAQQQDGAVTSEDLEEVPEGVEPARVVAWALLTAA